jgi:hypothetical protein
MRQATLVLVAFALVVCALTAAHADYISYSNTYNIPPNDEDYQAQVSFKQFDPTLGTLVGIAFSCSDSGEHEWDIENWNDDGADYKVYYQSGTTTNYQAQDSGWVNAWDMADGYFSYGPLLQWSSGYYTNPDLLAGYTGTGTVAPSGAYTAPIYYGLYSEPSGAAFEFWDDGGDYRQTWTVTYDYTPAGGHEDTPEPCSLALLACGLGAGVLRLRRRS